MIQHFIVNGKYEAKLKAPVALVFFVRPVMLEQIFNEVKKARPEKLFLIQDGPRRNRKDDIENINKCREIVSNIDWKCEVYKNYAEENMGCAKRPFTGFSWVFENVDRAIILEDDCLPNQSFFKFCEVLLEKYLVDDRINMITGYNFHDEMPEVEESYFFGKSGTNWGWATWARAWDLAEFTLSKINADSRSKYLFKKLDSPRVASKKVWFLNNVERLIEKDNWTAWDVQWGVVKDLFFQVAIIPKVNMIDNIGYGNDSTHFSEYNTLSFDDKKLFRRHKLEMEFPLVHPTYIIPNKEYDTYVESIVYPSIFRKILRRIDSYSKKIILGLIRKMKKN